MKNFKGLESVSRIACSIFLSALGCCALRMLVKICFFNVVCSKKLTKGRNSKKFDPKFSKKKQGFEVCTGTLVECFFTRKIKFSVVKLFEKLLYVFKGKHNLNKKSPENVFHPVRFVSFEFLTNL